MGDQVEAAITVAMTKLGAPYVWATAGPDTFDCSGFTWWVASQVLGPQDYELRSSHHQFNVWGDRVRGDDPSGAQPGDLVFFNTMGVTIMGNQASHVGMMIEGPEGTPRFIHAANEDLGVRIDRLEADWYAPKYIGARRIYAPAPGIDAPDTDNPAALPPMPHGPVKTRTPWNGQPFGVTWDAVYQWRDDLERAASAERLDVRQLAVLMMIETQGIHWRDGGVLTVWDNHPEDGPSVGLMQVKPEVWGWLLQAADPYTPAGNIRLGAAVLRHLIETYGSFEAAIAESYHPGVAPNGTTPARYVATARGLLGELGYAT
jgi:hypothetical protein